MKLFLFGGAETDQGQASTLKKQINTVLAEIKPKQLLHIPYARVEVPKGEEDVWGEGWVKRDLNLNGIELLDARAKEDLDKADSPTIFINGGPQRDNIYEKIISNSQLHHLTEKAEFIIGESSGSMVCAEFRITQKNNKGMTVKGLGILKDTIIEPHYSERNRQEALREEMKESKVKYGIGIDSITAVVIDTGSYPDNLKKIGEGIVDFVRIKDFL